MCGLNLVAHCIAPVAPPLSFSHLTHSTPLLRFHVNVRRTTTARRGRGGGKVIVPRVHGLIPLSKYDPVGKSTKTVWWV